MAPGLLQLKLLSLLVLLLENTPLVRSQQLQNSSSYSNSSTCGALFNNANGTGAADFGNGVEVDFEYSSNSTQVNDLQWALTLDFTPNNASTSDESEGTYSNTIWLGTPFTSQNFTARNVSFSGCAFLFEQLPTNTVDMGQADNGTCLSTLDSQCIAALQGQAEAASAAAVDAFDASYPPNFNQSSTTTTTTTNSSSLLCEAVQKNLSASLPEACSPFFSGVTGFGTEGGPKIDYAGFTPDNSPADRCQTVPSDFLQQETPGYAFVPVFNPVGVQVEGDNGSFPPALYDLLATQVYVALTLFAPTLGTPSPVDEIAAPLSFVNCLRVDSFSPGSRRPPALPAGTTVAFATNSSSQLSGGAITGIVVGCVVFLAAIVAFVFFFFLQRRRRRTQQQTQPTTTTRRAPNLSREREGIENESVGDVQEK